MDSSCQIGERRCVALLDFMHELLHIVAGRNVERTGELSVNGVLHDHIPHQAAVIDHDLQFPAHIFCAMATRDLIDDPFTFSCEYISSGGCCDVCAGSAQKRDVTDNDLAAHSKPSGEPAGG